jgi:LAO/AO transport system kinase
MTGNIDELLNGPDPVRPASLGRLISAIERGGNAAIEIDRAALSRLGRCSVVGITGAPGAGKSTLTGRLVSELRRRDARVAVLAIDPSSPYSGGAILGDRVRMLDHSLDQGVFIRSMATRGHLGGLALAAPAAVRVLAAAGFDVVLVETVGVGQAELDIGDVADTTVVVVTPGWGDEVQTTKAGLTEIADVFAVNKADRRGADETRRELRQMLHSRRPTEGEWTPTIVETVATQQTGIADLLAAVWRHRDWLERAGALAARRAARLWREVQRLVALRAAETAKARIADRDVGDVRRRVTAREIDPWLAAQELLDAVCRPDGR